MDYEIARLKRKAFPAQVNVPVTDEIHKRYHMLKLEHGINVAEEARKAITAMLDRLERSVAQKRA
jgi:hypothetical protein